MSSHSIGVNEERKKLWIRQLCTVCTFCAICTIFLCHQAGDSVHPALKIRETTGSYYTVECNQTDQWQNSTVWIHCSIEDNTKGETTQAVNPYLKHHASEVIIRPYHRNLIGCSHLHRTMGGFHRNFGLTHFSWICQGWSGVTKARWGIVFNSVWYA